MMKHILFSLLILYSAHVSANADLSVDITPDISVDQPVDTSAKDSKIMTCVAEYVKKQSKSYAKSVQGNLYDLIHNFDRIAALIHGKTPRSNDVSFERKIVALAKVQCELYYSMGVLK